MVTTWLFVKGKVLDPGGRLLIFEKCNPRFHSPQAMLECECPLLLIGCILCMAQSETCVSFLFTEPGSARILEFCFFECTHWMDS